MKKHLEIMTVEHKGIKVVIKLDYENGKAGLVDLLTSNGNIQTPGKKWLFDNRGLEYMNSWLNIIEAMSMAVKECKKNLESDLAEKSKFKDDCIRGILIPRDLKPKSFKKLCKK